MNEDAISQIEKAVPTLNGQAVIKLNNGHSYMATKVNTETYNWTYYVVKPVEELNSQASNILTMIIVICVLLIVVGCLFSFIYTFKIYNPIVKIGQILTDKQHGINLDNEPFHTMNDFNQIGAGVHQLIHYHHRYEHELEKLTYDYLNYSLLTVMRNDERSLHAEEELLKVMSSKLDFNKDAYRCCAIAFSFTNKFYEEIQDIDRILIQSKIKVLITGFLERTSNVYVIERDKFLYLCISNVESQADQDPFNQGLNLLIQTFSNDRQYCNIQVGVGETYAGLDGIRHSYSNALSALQSIPKEETFTVVYADTLQVKHNYQFSKTDESKLLNILKIGKKDDLVSFLEELFRRNENISFNLRNTLVGEIYEVGKRYAFESEIEIGQFLTEQQQHDLKRQCELPSELEARLQLLTYFLYGLVEYINEIKQQLNKSDVLALMIKQYVEEHYCQDLSLIYSVKLTLNFVYA